MEKGKGKLRSSCGQRLNLNLNLNLFPLILHLASCLLLPVYSFNLFTKYFVLNLSRAYASLVSNDVLSTLTSFKTCNRIFLAPILSLCTSFVRADEKYPMYLFAVVWSLIQPNEKDWVV